MLSRFEMPSGAVARLPWDGRLLNPEWRLESFFRLNRETDRNIGGTVEGLEHLAAKQAAILAPGAALRRQFDAPIPGMTNGTGEI